MLKAGEMPPRAVDILAALQAGEQICAGDLKKRLRFSDTTMYRNLHFLEKKGLVERIEEHPESKNGRPKYTKSRGRGRKPTVFWRRRVHRFMKEKIGPYQELPRGPRPGQKCVPREAYPEIVRRSKDELLSVIGRDYGVTSGTIRRICKRAGQ